MDGSFRNAVLAHEECPPGNGWRAELKECCINSLRDSAGLCITGSTVPAASISSSQYILSFAASTGDTCYLVFQVPRNYDDAKAIGGSSTSTAKRHLMVSIGAYVSAGADTPTITLTAVAQPPVGALKTAYAPAASSALTSTLATYTFDFAQLNSAEGYKIQPGDTVTVKIVISTHNNASTVVFKSICGTFSMSPNFTTKAARYSATGLEQLTP